MKEKYLEKVKEIVEQCIKDSSDVLDLSYHGLLNSNIPMIIDAIGKNPNLKRINLSHNHLSKPLELVKAINKHPNIEAVNLSHNGSYYQEATKVVDELSSNVRITEFDMDLYVKYGAKEKWDNHYVHKLRNFLKRNKIIKKVIEEKDQDVSLRFSDLCANDVIAVCKTLIDKGVDWVRSVDLSDCNLCVTDKALIALSELILKNKDLKTVYMANNSIKTNSIAHFKEFLDERGVRFVFHGALTPTVDGVEKFESNLTAEHINFRRRLGADVVLADLTGKNVIPTEKNFALKDLSYLDFNTRLVSRDSSELSVRLQHYYGDTHVVSLTYFIFPRNMERANFHRSSFLGVDMPERYLKSANLSSTFFQLALLYKSNLSYANLTGACFHKADLKRANLSHTQAESTDFTEARLSEANLTNANMQYSMFVKGNLRAADFRGANLKGANFTNANLKSANLSGCDLSETIGLNTANLKGTYLYGAKLPQGVWAPTQEEKFKRDVNQIMSSLWKKNKLYGVFSKLASSEKPHFSELSGKELKMLHKSYRRRATKGFMNEYDSTIKQTNREKVYKDVYLTKFFNSLGVPEKAQAIIKSHVDELPAEPFLNAREMKSFG